MASGYSPVFRSMLTSSIWEEKPHVKILWLTMLLMKDKRGIVEGSIPGLARMAVITIEQCEEALAVLMAPDRYSRTKELEGRRLLPIDGGWRVVNHEKYSNLVAESSKERVARHRQRAKMANVDETECNVTCNDPGSRLEVTGLISSEEEETEKKELTPRQQVIDHYFRQFEAARGVKPSLDGRGWKSFDRLLERLGHNVDACNEAITNAFADDWWRSKVTINKIANDTDQFTGRRSSPSRRNQPPQPNDENDRYKPRIFGDP